MTDLITTFVTVLGTLGGWEAIKWMLTRHAHKKIAAASAEQAEIQTEEAEFLYLRKRIEFLDEQLLLKEKRFAEQTGVLRDTQRELVEAVKEKGELSAEIAALKAERALKLCERRGCRDRQPQSGY